MLSQKNYSGVNPIPSSFKEEYQIKDIPYLVYCTGKSCLSSALNLGKIVIKEYTKGIFFGLGKLILTFTASSKAMKLGISPNMLFSSSSKYFFQSYADKVVFIGDTLTDTVLSCLNIPQESHHSYRHYLDSAFSYPITEEILFRGILQELILRRIPKKVLEATAPDYVWLVDSMPAKILRIGCSSALFALGHTVFWDSSVGGTVPQFMGGIVSGIIVEYNNGNVLKSIITHQISNLYVAGIMELGK